MKILASLLLVLALFVGLILIAEGAEKTVTVTIDSAVIGLWMWFAAAFLGLRAVFLLGRMAWRRWVRP
jgi:hypothetical protein